MKKSEISYNEILKQIKIYENGPAVDAMERMGLKYEKNFGVSISNLKKIAGKYKPNSEIANLLRKKNIRETGILAEMIEDENNISAEQTDKIVQNIDTIEIVEQTCINLLEKVENCRFKAIDWVKSDKEFVKTTGYILYSRLAQIDKNSGNDFFESFLSYAIKDSEDKSIHVRKSVAKALRYTALRNDRLKVKVLSTAEKIKSNNSRISDIVYEEVVPLLNY